MVARRFSIVMMILALLAGCNSSSTPTSSVRPRATAAAPAPAPAVPQCTMTVVNGYPTSYSCNAAAQAVQETLSCELESFNQIGQLHGIQPGLPASQITWWCQTEMASAIVLSCQQSANNPCSQMHIYPGIVIFNKAAAIQHALSQNLVPAVDTAPDGLPCPSGAGGDLGGVADMDGLDGPYVNWIMNRDNAINYNDFGDGDFNNVNSRVPFYQGACTRPSTHTLFLAQRQLHAIQNGKPSSGCPTPNTPFALNNGNVDLNQLNQLAADVGCPTYPSMTAATEAERQACLAIIADEQRITRDQQMGLFPGGFAFVQLRRQYAAFAGLQCNAQFAINDLNAGLCDPVKCTPTTACGVNGCVGVCGNCNGSNLQCDPNGQCVPACVPKCSGKQCGPDGCGGVCGQCGAGTSCDVAGHCEPLAASTAISFAKDVQPILDARCTGCHSGGQLDFDFVDGVSYAKLVNGKSKSCTGRTFVIPGDADHSYLMDKVQGVLGLCAGSSMRYGTTDAEVQILKNWVNQGAPNN
jgi:hypothetical protein